MKEDILPFVNANSREWVSAIKKTVQQRLDGEIRPWFNRETERIYREELAKFAIQIYGIKLTDYPGLEMRIVLGELKNGEKDERRD